MVQVLVELVQVLVMIFILVLVLTLVSPCRLVDFTRLPSPTPENKDLFFVTKGSSLQPASGDLAPQPKVLRTLSFDLRLTVL